MKIVSTNVFVGPNIWAGFPVIRHVVDLGVLEDWPSAKIGDAWIEALVEALPGLRDAMKKKVTRREKFLVEMDAVVPWDRLVALIASHYPKAGPKGRAVKAIKAAKAQRVMG